MRIALDFDGTYTADPILWNTFVSLAKERGHDVKIVTARSPYKNIFPGYDDNNDVHEASALMGIEVVFCDMVQKQDVYGADIWIDDRPDMVVGKSQARYLMTVLQNEDNEKLTGFGRASLNKHTPEDPHLA
jgi:hypothetical protein